MTKEFLDWLREIYPLVLSRKLQRADSNELGLGQVSIYWAGTVIRIDIKPK